MGKALHKLAGGIYNHAKITIFAVIAVIAIVAGIGLHAGVNFSGASLELPDSESAKAMKTLAKEFPAMSPKGGQMKIVFHSKTNLTSEANTKAINATLAEIQKQAGVTTVAAPEMIHSYDKKGTTAYAMVIFKQEAADVSAKQVSRVRDAIKTTKNAGIQTELSGTVTISPMDQGEEAEGFGVLIAYVILAITFASLLVAGLPILSALLGLASSMMVIIFLTNYLDIPTVSSSLVGMMGLAVGIDYALFIISRYRQELTTAPSRKIALQKAMASAGVAVIFAGMTVVVAMVAMTTLGISFLGTMGITAAIGVVFAMFMSLTFVPALLTLIGDRVRPGHGNRLLSAFANLRIVGGWGRFVTKHKIILTLVTVAGLAMATVPFGHMNLGLPNDGGKSTSLTERRAYDLETAAYGEGSEATLVVIAQGDSAEAVADTQKEITDHIADVSSVSPAQPSADNKYYFFTVIPKTDANSPKTKKLVHDIRDLSKKGDVKMEITGATAISIDLSDTIGKALPKFAVIIVVFAFILLVAVFRSLLIPLVAVGGFALSLGATLGALVWILQDGHLISLLGIPTKIAVLNFLPVLVIGIMFGLAMDYEVFLVSRIREIYKEHGDTKLAVQEGVKANGPAIMAAIFIMVAVFSGFVFASDATVKSMGLALSGGVLFDALLVRMILVPATIAWFGRANWYLPKWLDRILPQVHID
ncbi:MMPL family transporter [Lactococcus insecticola]|uniref:Membrane protein YdfJ n=1 Tax=Pseudolactococcus insecticola TaxID=2709158 RepID=A0A6A0B7E2_9LACT|nr:MMPL family transporter [Lactococcus insecticola]GFH40411.1 membrane protein YdfJ [Lactococcus insecticola]